MKDRVGNDIRAKETLQEWSTIDWKAVKKRVRNLRQRIYRATQNGQWNKVKSLMKLMLRSYSNLLLSVRRVTQENQGKQTAGIDGQTVLNPEKRVELVTEMAEHSLWKASKRQKGIHSKVKWKTKTIRNSDYYRPSSTSSPKKCFRTKLGSKI